MATSEEEKRHAEKLAQEYGNTWFHASDDRFGHINEGLSRLDSRLTQDGKEMFASTFIGSAYYSEATTSHGRSKINVGVFAGSDRENPSRDLTLYSNFAYALSQTLTGAFAAAGRREGLMSLSKDMETYLDHFNLSPTANITGIIAVQAYGQYYFVTYQHGSEPGHKFSVDRTPAEDAIVAKSWLENFREIMDKRQQKEVRLRGGVQNLVIDFNGLPPEENQPESPVPYVLPPEGLSPEEQREKIHRAVQTIHGFVMRETAKDALKEHPNLVHSHRTLDLMEADGMNSHVYSFVADRVWQIDDSLRRAEELGEGARFLEQAKYILTVVKARNVLMDYDPAVIMPSDLRPPTVAGEKPFVEENRFENMIIGNISMPAAEFRQRLREGLETAGEELSLEVQTFSDRQRINLDNITLREVIKVL